MVDRADRQAGGAQGAIDTVILLAAEHGNRADRLIEILHDVQARLGYVPPESLDALARAVNRSRAEVHGVVSFYHDFRDRPAGRHVIKLCRAEACQAVGCEELAARAEELAGAKFGATSTDGRITLEAIYCLGNCALGPAALIDGELHGSLNNDKLYRLIKSLG